MYIATGDNPSEISGNLSAPPIRLSFTEEGVERRIRKGRRTRTERREYLKGERKRAARARAHASSRC